MSGSILLFLIIDMAALALAGATGRFVPGRNNGYVVAALSGAGALLCLPPLLLDLPPETLPLPAGPPGLTVQLALDSLSSFVLLIVLAGGAVIAAFQSASRAPASGIAACLSGAMLSLLAADGMTLALGLTAVCVTLWPSHRGTLLIPGCVFVAICLLTPAGFAPGFDTIRAAPVDSGRALAAAVLTLFGFAALLQRRSTGAQPGTHGHANHAASRNGDAGYAAIDVAVVYPVALYLLLRLTADLSGPSVPGWWGAVLAMSGGVLTCRHAWLAASAGCIDAIAGAMARRQAALMPMGLGVALIARAADLTVAESLALAATLLLALGGSLAATVTVLTAHAIASAAGTPRLSRLGGLIHTMPAASAALAAGLFATAALPPGLGFAALWLLFQSLLVSTGDGGLRAVLPLALTAALAAISAGFATSAAVRLLGVAVLSRPRTPQGAGAEDIATGARIVFATAAGLALLSGLCPGPVIRAAAEPVIRMLAGTASGFRAGAAVLTLAAGTPGYAPLSLAALIAVAVALVVVPLRLTRGAGKPAGPWLSGLEPPVGLPFGEPMAQSVGAGFLPVLPTPSAMGLPAAATIVSWLPWRQIRSLFRPVLRRFHRLSPATGLWLALGGFAVLLMILTLFGDGA